MALASLLAYIPSPSKGVLRIGPLPLHAYGLCLAAGVLVAVRIADNRYVRLRVLGRGTHRELTDADEPLVRRYRGTITDMSVAVVIAGIVGARIYHLFTGYDWDRGGIVGTVKIWQGGLSIWGAVAGGLLAAFVVTRRKHLAWLDVIDAMGPSIAIGQAIGRWGNWFNQELFGRPTKLPWGLKIDVAHRPANYKGFQTFHPTFLYESLWCLAIFVAITLLERRFRFRKGQAFALYMTLYTFERFFMELLRADQASKVFGMRFNALLSAVLFFIGLAWVIRTARRPFVEEERDDESDESEQLDVGNDDASEARDGGDERSDSGDPVDGADGAPEEVHAGGETPSSPE